MSLIGIIVAVIVICLVYWCLMRIMAAFGVGEPIATVVQVAFVLIVVLYLLSVVFGVGPTLRLR